MRTGARAATLAAGFLALSLVSVAGAVPQQPIIEPAGSEQPAFDDESIEVQVGFRNLIGFRSDEAYVRELNRNPVGAGASADRIETHGYPMTGAERRELAARRGLADESEKVDKYGEEHAEIYGGSYLDQRGGGLLRIGFTRDVEHHIAQLAERIPQYKDRLHGFAAAYTLSELRSLQTRVENDAAELLRQGIKLAALRVDIRASRVLVGVTDVTEEQRIQLASTYGSAAEVKEHAPMLGGHYPHQDPARSDFYANLRGGLHLEGAVSLADCSSAFVAFDVQIPLSVQHFLLTAGHCFQEGDVVNQGGDSIGAVERRIFDWGGPADGAAIRIDSARATRWVYVHPGAQSWQIRRSQLKAEDKEGDIVCIAGVYHPGAHSNQLCGVIFENDGSGFYENYDDTYIDELRFVDFGAQEKCVEGDSGAAWYSADIAVGVHGGHSLEAGYPFCFYTHIENVLDQLELKGIWPL